MDETTKLKQLRFLSNTNRKLHEQRRRIELRVLLTTLSLYIITAFAVLKGEIKKNSTELIIAIWIMFPILAFIAAAYLRSIHKSNRTNLSFAEKSEDEIANLIGIEEINKFIEKSNQDRVHPFWSWWWQTVTIFIVAIASALIITLVR